MKIRYPLFIYFSAALAAGLALSFDYKIMPAMPLTKARPAAPDCPALDDSHVVFNASDCSTDNGSIIGMHGTGTGTLVYTWFDKNNHVIAETADLLNVPAGTYRVSLKDDSKCPAVTAFYTIGVNNPISIDITNTIITSPSCNATNGSITNVEVIGIPIKYQWVNTIDPNVVLTTNKNLTNVGPGVYLLTVTNATGCIGQARYTINPGSYAPLMTSYITGNSDCANTGIFHATFDLKPTDPLYTYDISDVSGKSYFSGALAYTPTTDSVRITIPAPPQRGQVFPSPGLPTGKYTLTTFGPGGCVTKLLTFTIGHDVYKIDASHVIIRPNVCGDFTGSIMGVAFTGGPPPLNPKYDRAPNHGYFWTDSTGVRLSTGGYYLALVPAGKYTLHAVNFDGCVSDTVSFVIPDSVSSTVKPVLNDIKMCLPGTAALDVLNKDPNAYYRLYDSTQTVIDTSRAGYFARKVNKSTTFYIQSVYGLCGSPRVKVNVTVVNPGVSIPNAFTPNGDGINDNWGVTGLEQYPGTEVTVFNRNGQQVYHSINYSKPFDGRYNGKELPIGVYYYIIDTKKPDCRAGVSGSLTVIR